MILCCGEALIDMLPCETAAGEAAFAPYPGGAVFNTARALGRLGAETGFLCGLSSDLFGLHLLAALRESRVATELCPISDRPTTLAFVTLRDGQARYAFYDENTALRALSQAELPDIPAQVTTLFLGGISLVGEPCGSTFEALCASAGDRVVMLDPNIRPGFLRDIPAYRARLARMMARADIVKLSDEDLRWLSPDLPEAEAVAALLGLGPALVLITRGAKGATAWTARGLRSMPARAVAVVDTVGAGDTFNAGILAAFAAAGVLDRAALRVLDAQQIDAALALATRAAAITASRAGANPPWMHEMGAA